ncbi:MAG: hypothetical protein EXR93_04595 [Gemmatimonadetes bacterium]|nr:hypothetical protein [Gemmatimonadota bacterium]
MVLSEVRDSLRAILSSGQEFSRDLKQAGPETVLARAAALRSHCVGASSAVRRAETGLVTTTRGPIQLASVKAALQRVALILRQDCELGFAERGRGSHADTLRAWGPFRNQRVARVIEDYEQAVTAYAEVIGIKLDP